jgi:hypothetical protein
MRATTANPRRLPRAPTVDEAAARRSLRAQIARLEDELLGLGAPGGPAAEARGATLIGLTELERIRDGLSVRVSDLRRAADERGAEEEANRLLIEEMLLDPAAHRWTRVPRAAIGEKGCGGWHARPRFGLLGRLMNWWRVVISIGCPLAS